MLLKCPSRKSELNVSNFLVEQILVWNVEETCSRIAAVLSGEKEASGGQIGFSITLRPKNIKGGVFQFVPSRKRNLLLDKNMYRAS